MSMPKVRDVMTDHVVAVREVAPYKEIVAALTGSGQRGPGHRRRPAGRRRGFGS